MENNHQESIFGNALIRTVIKMVPIISESNHSNIERINQEDILKNFL